MTAQTSARAKPYCSSMNPSPEWNIGRQRILERFDFVAARLREWSTRGNGPTMAQGRRPWSREAGSRTVARETAVQRLHASLRPSITLRSRRHAPCPSSLALLLSARRVARARRRCRRRSQARDHARCRASRRPSAACTRCGTIPEACARHRRACSPARPSDPYKFAVVRISPTCQARARFVDAAKAQPSQATGWKFNDLIRVPNAACPSQQAVVRVWRKPAAVAPPELDAQGKSRIYLEEQKQGGRCRQARGRADVRRDDGGRGQACADRGVVDAIEAA